MVFRVYLTAGALPPNLRAGGSQERGSTRAVNPEVDPAPVWKVILPQKGRLSPR